MAFSVFNFSTDSKKRIGEIVEVCIVLALGFGLFIYSSTAAFIETYKTSATQIYNSYDFIFIICYEIIILTIIAYYLKSRHWKIKDFNLDFKLKMVGVAILLVVIRELAGIFLTRMGSIFEIINLETKSETKIDFQANILSIGMVAIVNSIYEEVLLIGYLFKRFEKFHTSIIILLSFVVRASYHTYQGWTNLPMVFILALVFGIYYSKYRKLWPLILAHGISNIFHFLNDHYQWLSAY